MKFGKLRLKNYVTFKSASFDLDRVGITQIQAHNKDAENNNGKDTNGAGKSVLFGSIPEAHWGKSPTGKSSGKQQPSKISIEYKDVGDKKHTYDFTRKFGGKKKGIKIKRNGEDINIRTIDLGVRRAQQILGMSEADFYTRVYVDSQIAHPLIAGSAAQRQDFFVDMFDLHSADSMRKLLLSEYREAQQNKAAYHEVRSLFEELREKALDSETLESKKKGLADLTAKQEQVLQKFRKTQAVRDLLVFEKDNEALIRKVYKLGDLEDFEALFNEAKRKLRSAKAKKELVEAWRVYDKEKDSYRAKARPLKAALNDLLGHGWEMDREKLPARSAKAREAIARRDSLKQELARLIVPAKPRDIAEPKHTYEACDHKINMLKGELRHAKEFRKGVCPTCGASVKARDVAEIQLEIEKWEDRKSRACEFRNAGASRLRYDEAVARRTELQGQLEAATIDAAKRERWIEAESLVRQIPDLPAPPGAVRDEVDGIEDIIDKYQRRLHVFRSAAPIIDKILEAAAFSDEARSKASEFDALGDRLNVLNNRIGSLTAEISSGKAAHSQLKQLADRGKTLKRKAADEPILKALIEIHSNKGLKKMMIQRCAKRLEDQINKFRRLFFVQDFQFEFKFDKKLELLVHRKTGDYTRTSDVRKLSGAQKRMFTILLVVATITLLPKSKRSNVLILDEPEANLGPAMQANFVKALPVLNKIVPHIVVISPRSDLEIPGAKVYTVVLERGVSTLKEGTT